MNIIDWIEDDEEEDDGTYDLVGFCQGKYVDIVKNFKGTWSVIYNNIRIKTEIKSRDEANVWAEKNDLINALCEHYDY